MRMYAVQLGGLLGENLSGDRIALVSDLDKKTIEKAAKGLILIRVDRKWPRKEFTLTRGCNKLYRLVHNRTHEIIPVRILKIINPKKFQDRIK